MISQQKYDAAIQLCGDFNKIVRDFKKLRDIFNNQIDPDEVSYNFHNTIGRVTDSLIVQEKWIFDLQQNLTDFCYDIVLHCDHINQPHLITNNSNQVTCKTCLTTYTYNSEDLIVKREA